MRCNIKVSQLSYPLSADPEAAQRRSGPSLPGSGEKSVSLVLNQGDSPTPYGVTTQPCQYKAATTID